MKTHRLAWNELSPQNLDNLLAGFKLVLFVLDDGTAWHCSESGDLPYGASLPRYLVRILFKNLASPTAYVGMLYHIERGSLGSKLSEDFSTNNPAAALDWLLTGKKLQMPTDRMLQFFKYEHLPPPLQEVSAPFCNLAKTIVETLPMNPERTVALRKLLEAKDCAVRSLLYVEQP